jgi:transcriptional regulator with XRE-family HTH domain
VVRGRKNPLHTGFPGRLSRARKDAKLSFSSLAAAANITSAKTTSTLERGDNIPRVDTVEKLARALRISPAFLAFGIDGPKATDATELCTSLGQRLRGLRLARGFSLREVERRADVAGDLVRRTEQGLTLPTLGTVEKLAKALGVSPAWLAYGLGPTEAASGKRTQPVSAQL